MILLAQQGRAVAEIATITFRSRDTVGYLTGVPMLGQADLRHIGQQLRLEGTKWS